MEDLLRIEIGIHIVFTMKKIDTHTHTQISFNVLIVIVHSIETFRSHEVK